MSVVMLYVFMLNAIMLNVVMLSIVTQTNTLAYFHHKINYSQNI